MCYVYLVFMVCVGYRVLSMGRVGEREYGNEGKNHPLAHPLSLAIPNILPTGTLDRAMVIWYRISNG